MTSYLDPRSGRTYPLDVPRWCGENRAPLLLTDLPGIGRADIAGGLRSIWRYAAALPFLPARPISLGEGRTPLLEMALDGGHALLKCEWFMPTGSFKDRGASVMLSLLREQGVASVLEDSSGNGGAAVSAYAAAGGMAATIFVPASTSPAKTVQSRASGARIALIPAAARTAPRPPSARPRLGMVASSMPATTGTPSSCKAPSCSPTSCGRISASAPRQRHRPLRRRLQRARASTSAFTDLLRAGRSPACRASSPPSRKTAAPSPAPPSASAPSAQPTIAEGTAIAQPIRLPECVAALRESGGGAVLLGESEIAEASLALARRGIYVEPTCAQAAAAFNKLREAGRIAARESTVIVLTGTGLKSTPRYAELLGVEA
jgi:threonine synthase